MQILIGSELNIEITKMKHTYKLIATLIAILNCSIGEAQNPIVQTNYTADPAPMVYKLKI